LGDLIETRCPQISELLERKNMLAPRAKGTSRLVLALLLLGITSCEEYEYDIRITDYNPADAYPGTTIVGSLGYPRSLFSVDMAGNVLWSFEDEELKCDEFWDFEVLDTNDILYLCPNSLVAILRPPDTVLWERWVQGAHHSVLMLPWGNLLYLKHRLVQADPWQELVESDTIRELDMETGEIVWEWHLEDCISPTAHFCPLCMETIHLDTYRDWSHSNALHYYEQDSSILLNARNLNTIVLLSYPSGDVLWVCGDAGTFGGGLFHHPHDAERLPNGNIVMFDNDEHAGHPVRSRALELAIDPVAQTAEVVWEWRDDDLYAPIMGDANRLPNGNTLVTDPAKGRVIEVNPSGEKVWEMLMKHPVPDHFHQFYKSERIPNES